MSSLNKSPFLKIFLSYAPFIMLFFSVFNEFDFNYLKLDYFSFNFVHLLIFFWTLRNPDQLGYLAIFFAGMWLMARRKIENWIFWIIGDLISIPLYFYKGFTLTSLQYLLFTGIAILGYRSWKRHINSSPLAAEE